MSHYSKHVFICTNQKLLGKKCCTQEGGEAAFSHVKERLLELDLFGPGKIRVSKSGCLGRCSAGPCVVVYPEAVWYRYASLEDLNLIIDSHLCHDKHVNTLLIDDFSDNP